MKVEIASPAQANVLPRVYTKPTLTFLGGLAEMTAAGCGGSNESAGKFCATQPTYKSNDNC